MRRSSMIALLFGVLLSIVPFAQNAHATGTFVVTSTADTLDPGTLRSAIVASNASGPGPNTITFSIAPGGAQTINLNVTQGNFPAISTPVTIDGTTQGGACTVPCITINGGLVKGFNVTAASSTIKGLILSGFATEGLRLAGASDTLTQSVVQNVNGLGVIVTGLNAVIGGAAAGAGNTIGNNNGTGLELDGGSTTVLGNFIGVTPTAANVSNNGTGVRVNSTGNTIGGTLSGQPNSIWNNNGAGVAVVGGSSNRISANSIQLNSQLGIDLGLTGVTANTPGGPHGGANLSQNFPVITSVVQGATLTISGALNSTPSTTFSIELFSNTACDSSSFGEGNHLIALTNATTNASGDGTFTVVVAPVLPAGGVVTGTATDPGGNTSEFSHCVAPGSNVRPGVFRNGTFFFRNTLTSGPADTSFTFGQAGDMPVTGDWNKDGLVTTGLFRNGQWFLRNSNTSGVADIAFTFGQAGDTPIAGDWNNDGFDEVGVVRNTGGVVQVFLRNTLTSGIADTTFNYATPGDQPVAGDWNGDGTDTIGVGRPNGSTFNWFLRNTNTTGIQDVAFTFGTAPGFTIAGDWDGTASDKTGTVQTFGSSLLWSLRNTLTTGNADTTFTFGSPGDIPVVG